MNRKKMEKITNWVKNNPKPFLYVWLFGIITTTIADWYSAAITLFFLQIIDSTWILQIINFIFWSFFVLIPFITLKHLSKKPDKVDMENCSLDEQ